MFSEKYEQKKNPLLKRSRYIWLLNPDNMENFRIHGDFFGTEDIFPLTSALRGVIHRQKEVEAAIKRLNIDT